MRMLMMLLPMMLLLLPMMMLMMMIMLTLPKLWMRGSGTICMQSLCAGFSYSTKTYAHPVHGTFMTHRAHSAHDANADAVTKKASERHQEEPTGRPGAPKQWKKLKSILSFAS